MKVPTPVQSNDNKPHAPAVGRFGIVAGVELQAYRPAGCPSLEQFEARFREANDHGEPTRAA